MARLQARAESIHSLTISGRLKLKHHDEDMPSARFKIWFMRKGDSMSLRLKALGPFGSTVFDMVAIGNDAWIYVAKEGRVYSGNMFLTKYGNISVKTALSLMEMLLNPWSPGLSSALKETTCPSYAQDMKCLSSRILGMDFQFWYEKDLRPKRFFSKTVSMHFYFDQEKEKPRIYPSRLAFNFLKARLKGSILISDVDVNADFDEARIFYPGFMGPNKPIGP